MTTLHPAAIPCGATCYSTATTATTGSRVLAALLRMLAPLAWLR